MMLDLDGTPNKANLGANAILGVSLAVARAAASSVGLPLYRYLGGSAARLLPVPCFNVINGGAHASNSIDIQEFMLVPGGAPSFREALRAGAEVYHALQGVLAGKGLPTNVGDEGGFAPDLPTVGRRCSCCSERSRRPGTGSVTRWASPSTPPPPSWSPTAGTTSKGRSTRSSGCSTTGRASRRHCPWSRSRTGSPRVTGRVGGCSPTGSATVQLVGDDLFVTNEEIVRRGIEEGVANAVLVKVNQIGTLSETLHTMAMAATNGYGRMVSHRSGETEDSFIAHLAVATNAGQIKSGAPARGERTAKYNQLLRIEESLGPAARYAGWGPSGGGHDRGRLRGARGRRPRRGCLVALVFVGLVAGVLTNVVPVRQIVAHHRQVEAAEEQLAALHAANAELEAEIAKLQTPTEVERIARETFGYVDPGEVAYRVVDPEGADPKPGAGRREDSPPSEADTAWYEDVWDFVTGADLA